MKQYEFDAVIVEDPDSGGAYVIFPWDIRKEFGKGMNSLREKGNSTSIAMMTQGTLMRRKNSLKSAEQR